jgi:hypothetical protein
LRSLAGTNNAILSQFGFSTELLENESIKREKAKELEVCIKNLENEIFKLFLFYRK